MMAAHRFQDSKTIGGGHTDAEKQKLQQEVNAYKEEAERVSQSPVPFEGIQLIQCRRTSSRSSRRLLDWFLRVRLLV